MHVFPMNNLNVFTCIPGGGGGYLVQKTLQGCAANMGSKISLLVYEWPLIKRKIWYMNGLIFQMFPKFESNLAQIQENFGKIGWFCSKFGQKMDRLVYERVTFSWKIGICMGLLSNSVVAHPYQNQTWVPPWACIQPLVAYFKLFIWSSSKHVLLLLQRQIADKI